MTGHTRYERMAVGHVLGGLDEVDRAAFRAHLLECSDCRRRVNELRDIASDLARTEREERRLAGNGTVDVEAEPETDDRDAQAAEVAPVRQWPWGVVVIGLVPLLVLGTLAWAVWQRAQTDLTAAVATAQQQVLDVLASGEPVPFESVEDVQGMIAADGERVGVNLAGLPELRPDEALLVWLLGDEGEAVGRTRPYLPSQVDGTLVASLDHPPEATALVVSIETDLTELAGPEGYRILTGSVPAVPAVSVPAEG